MKKFISGVIMIIIFLPLVIIGKLPFQLLLAVLGVLALKELMDLKSHHNSVSKGIRILSYFLFLLFIFNSIDAFNLDYKRISILYITLFFPVIFFNKTKYTTKDAFYLSGSIFLLGTFFNSLMVIRNANLYLFLYLILIPILTDTFAMWIGKWFGKHLCAPNISPNKTWEGAIGGAVLSTAICTMFYYKVVAQFPIYILIGATLLLSVVGEIGDLLFSEIKRENKIKDFSNVIPGHGGILDRIDSLIFVTLAFIILFS